MAPERLKSIASALGLAAATALLVLASETLHLARVNSRFVADIGGELWLVAAKYMAVALVSGAVIGALVRDVLRQSFAVAAVWYLIISLKILWLGSKLLTKPVVLVAFIAATVVLHVAGWLVAKKLRLSCCFPVMVTVAYANVGIAAVIAWAQFGGDLRGFLGAGGMLLALGLGAVVVTATIVLDRLLGARLPRVGPVVLLSVAIVTGGVAIVILSADEAPPNHQRTTTTGSGDDIYVVSFDALRFDALAEFVAQNPTSQLGLLVRTSTSFENVSTRGPSTQSTMTEHTFGSSSTSCEDSIPSQLHARGYRTLMLFALAGARVAGADCYGTYFSGQGSPLASHYSLVALTQRLVGTSLDREKYLPASELLERLRASATTTEPMYAFMHFLELHSPYAPRSMRGDPRYAGRIREYTSTCLVAGCDLLQPRNQELAATARAGYQALMTEVDSVVGEILGIARQRKRPFRVVVTADHGELFGEYGAFAHRFGFVPELRHVPFVVHNSTQQTAARRCELMLSGDALRVTALGGAYPDHERLTIDVADVGRAVIERATATLSFELSESAVANSGVSRNMHREAKGTLSYPITKCQ